MFVQIQNNEIEWFSGIYVQTKLQQFWDGRVLLCCALTTKRSFASRSNESACFIACVNLQCKNSKKKQQKKR